MPIVIGDDSGGGAGNLGFEDLTLLSRFQAPADATVGRMLFLMGSILSEGEEVKMCMYEDDTGSPGNLIEVTDAIIGIDPWLPTGWTIATLLTPVAITQDEWYWLGVNSAVGGSAIRYDLTGGDHHNVADDYTDGWLDPIVGGTSGTRNYNIYGIQPAPPATGTLGYESIGASSQAVLTDEHLVCQFTAGYTGVVYKLKAYIKNFAAGEHLRLTIYSNDIEAPVRLQNYTDEITGTGVDGWVTGTLTQPIALTSGVTYWLGVHSDDSVDVAYDAGTYEMSRIASDTYSSPLETWTGGSNVVRKYSIHASLETVDARWIGFKAALDPTAGDGPWANSVYLVRVTAIEDLTIDSIGGWFSSDFATGEYVKAAVYSDNDTDTPINLLGESDPMEGEDTGKYYNALLQTPISFVSGNSYWIGFIAPQDTYYIPSGSTTLPDDFNYVVNDTYSDGPEDPCNTPAGYDSDGWVATIFAEEAAPAVDSQFGLQTIGASDDAITADYSFVSRKKATFTGIVRSVGGYIKNAGLDEEFRITIYSDNAGNPDVYLATTPQLLGTGVDGWFTAELAMPISVTRESYYWIGVHTDDGLTLTYDAGSESYEVAADAYAYANSPYPAGSGGSDREYSLYFNTEMLTSTRRWMGHKQRFFRTAGGLFDTWGAGPDVILLTKVVAVEDLTVESIWCYTTAGFVTGSYAVGMIYADNAGTPDALLGETDPVQGASLEQWHNAPLQSTVDLVAGETYWIGWIGDTNMTWMNAPWGWMGSLWEEYQVADTYVGGPEDPCNSPPDDDSYGGSPYYAEAIEDVDEDGIDAQPGVFIDML